MPIWKLGKFLGSSWRTYVLPWPFIHNGFYSWRKKWWKSAPLGSDVSDGLFKSMAVDHVRALTLQKFYVFFLWSAQPLRGWRIEPSHKFLEGYLCCMVSFCNLHFDFTQKINGPIDVTFLTTQAFDQEPYLHGESSPLKSPTALRTRNLGGNKYTEFDDSW